MRKQLEVGKLYVIEWHDASFCDEQRDISELEDDIGVMCKSVGWLVKQTRSGLRLAMEVDLDGGEGRYFMDIPQRMVRKVRELHYD